jgi:hypothetical protein
MSSWPWAWSSAATADESTPPDMATAMVLLGVIEGQIHNSLYSMIPGRGELRLSWRLALKLFDRLAVGFWRTRQSRLIA